MIRAFTMSPSRRAFLQSAALSGVALAQTGPAASNVPPERRVYLIGDGVISTPAEDARLLTRIADEHAIASDNYLKGGAVEQMAEQFATLLGKARGMRPA